MLLSAHQHKLRGRWAWRIALVWLSALLIVAIFGDWIIELFGLPAADHLDRSCIGGCAPLVGTGSVHVLGTDSLGRDVLSQLIGGTRTALLGGIAASGLSFLIGYVLGSWAAWFSKSDHKLSWLVLAEALLTCIAASYAWNFTADQAWFHGYTAFISTLFAFVTGVGIMAITLKSTKNARIGIRPDHLMLFVAEVFSSVPALLLLLALAAMAFRPGLVQLVLIYVFVRWTRFAVLAQQEVKAALASPYVQAAFHSGLSNRKVLWHHILPNTFGTLWVQALLGVSAFIIIEGTFSFLGLGLPAEQASWGRLVAEARSVAGGWWLWVFPGLVLSSTILSLQTLGKNFPAILKDLGRQSFN